LQVIADARFDIAARIEWVVDPETNDRHTRDHGACDLVRPHGLQQDDEAAFVRGGRLDATECGSSFELDQVGFRTDNRFRHTQHIEPVAILARLVGDQDDS